MNKKEVIEKIKNIVDNAVSFKIGKTGLTLKERFADPDYEHYSNIKPICGSSKKKDIDRLEKELIETFQSDKEFNDKCDNVQIGGGEMDDSEVYKIYVVYK